MIIYLFHFCFTTSVGPKNGFKKSCFRCPVQNTCITIFGKPKSTSISPHNFYSTLCNKESPWIALYNSTHIGVVTLPQCHLLASDYGIRRTLYKNLLKNLNTRVHKPSKYNLLHSTKFPKLGVILCTMWYWLQIRLYWILFEIQKRFNMSSSHYILTYLNS